MTNVVLDVSSSIGLSGLEWVLGAFIILDLGLLGARTTEVLTHHETNGVLDLMFKAAVTGTLTALAIFAGRLT